MLVHPKRKYTINSLGRGLKILFILGQAAEPMRISEISRRLEIDKSTAYRIVSTLREQGFVEQDPETRKYLLAVKVIEVGGLKLRSIKFLPTAKPVIEELMLHTREAVHIAVLVEGEVMYVATEQCSGTYNVNTVVGGRASLHSTAVGKALLAELPEVEIDRLISLKGMTRFTDRTIINLEELRRDLALVRERGWAMDNEETYTAVRCIASVIRDHQGKALASAGLSGPAQRISDNRIPTLAELVKDACDKISRRMGYVRLSASPLPAPRDQNISTKASPQFPSRALSPQR
jgi:DNA-binding IclR family transcriptional regulator